METDFKPGDGHKRNMGRSFRDETSGNLREGECPDPANLPPTMRRAVTSEVVSPAV
jgi:hypothetical protein